MIGPFTNETFIMFLVYLFSLFLYVTILIVIVKNRKDEILSGAFFKFSFLLGLYDIVAAFATWFLLKFRYIVPFFDFYISFDPFFARLGAYLTWLTYFGQLAGLTMIMLNRFTCIVFPLKTIEVQFISKYFLFLH